jgi:hypothetical protein
VGDLDGDLAVLAVGEVDILAESLDMGIEPDTSTPWFISISKTTQDLGEVDLLRCNSTIGLDGSSLNHHKSRLHMQLVSGPQCYKKRHLHHAEPYRRNEQDAKAS